MNEYLIDLINRMLVIEHLNNSEDEISWKAHREAEKLNNPDYINQLIEYIKQNNKPKQKNIRRRCYFVLGKLLLKIPNDNALQFMIDQLMFETDKYIIEAMLDLLAYIHKPESVDLTNIFELTKHEKWQIRHSAINSLQNSESNLVREEIIKIINSCIDSPKEFRYELSYAIPILSTLGKIEDLPLLKKLQSIRISDVRGASEYAIEEILKRGV